MNQRIQELALQANGSFGTGSEFAVVFGEPEDFNKFTKLIVEECCKRLSEETILHDGYGYNQHELYNRLRKHFGVAE
jgi:hypothetical protein